jgi:CRISPR-associated endonuclease/helicase Cas3
MNINVYSQFFIKQYTGFAPYKYQLKVAELLLGGKNVILTVPTGAGKTWASIRPFLFLNAQQTSELDFPKKMIYSLPTTHVSQFYLFKCI